MYSQIKNFCRITFLIILVGSCESDLNPKLTSASIPLVYGIINPQDSIYYIRLSKTFNGEGNAYDFDRIPDSIYFKNARVFLKSVIFKGS